MKTNNLKINENTLVVMLVVMVSTIFMFGVLVCANVMEETIHKHDEQMYMKKIGLTQAFINKVNIVKTLLSLGISCALSIAFFFLLKSLYFYYLKDFIGIYSLATKGYAILWIPCSTIVILLVFIVFTSRKKGSCRANQDL